MSDALRRFGIPADMVSMVDAIYAAQFFTTVGHTGKSTERRQNAGIAQGCPEPDYVVTRDELYADDTLLISRSKQNMQNMLNAIVAESRKYGLELNWSKTLQMQMCTNCTVERPDGGPIATIREAIYLGGMITCDARASPELTRRSGEAQRIFKQLAKIWGHTSVGWKHKCKVYESCVLGKLFYSLDYMLFIECQETWAGCFSLPVSTEAFGIPHSYIPRVTNAD
eukprot:8357224-Pyramimonas_sp.AAC.1